MGLLDRIRRRKSGTDSGPTKVASQVPAGLEVQMDESGAAWTTNQESLAILEAGGGTATLADQFIVLSMLEEAGIALRLPGMGFSVSTEDIARLGEDVAEVLALPPTFSEQFSVDRRSNTTSAAFGISVRALRGEHPEPYTRAGAFLQVGDNRYRLTSPVLHALEAIETHQALGSNDRGEIANVRLIAQLQKAQREASNFRPNNLDDAIDDAPSEGVAFPLDLGYFQRFQTSTPEKVGLTVEELGDGSLALTPNLGTGHGAGELNQRRHQLALDRDENVVRIDNDLILLEKQQMDGVREIYRLPRIPAERVGDFYEAPGSFIDPEKVDMEGVFSVRVKGIGVMAPVSFNQAAESGIQWIDDADEVLEPEILAELAETEDELTDVEESVERARSGNSLVAACGEHLIDISDATRVDASLSRARQKFLEPVSPLQGKSEDAVQVGFIINEADSLSGRLRAAALDADLPRPIAYSGLRREPFPHQRQGIEWMVRLMSAALTGKRDDPSRVQGAILADDMGLGKTFMTLVAVREMMELEQRRGSRPRPTLAVLPLSLIDNWKDEISETFTRSPFNDVAVLQASEDLNRFKYRGAQRESAASASLLDADGMLSEEDLTLSLAVGPQAGEDRLDQPGRLVITTYETLASYQLSLGQVEWGAVIFDEAQKTKNPETLAARAAKGLKASFKLICTGTPVENRLKDLWSLMDTAQPGLLGTWPEFNREWVRSVEESSAQAQLNKGRGLAEHVRPFMLRRIKEDHLHNLPPKTIHSGLPGDGVDYLPELHRHMPEEQAHKYLQALSSHSARIGKKGAALKTLHGLKAVSLHPVDRHIRPVHGEVSPEAAARVQASFGILDQVQENREKAIVFLIDKMLQRLMARWLQERYGVRVHIINGDTQALAGGKSPSRKQLIADFQGREGFGVIIMSPVAAGTGLTVTAANHAIHLERHWNPAKEAQATDRIYRIGQQRPVHVYLPLAIHPDESIRSFDANLNQLLRRKTDLKDAVVVPEAVSEKEMISALGLE
ncbi:MULTISPECIES: DEAD/DEAH box helicase [Arthrobacter]|uniref:DEAD/DEAH box helicase n=1 Tax=Arthrobacter TaxID=1663 RepID=UPI003FD3EFA6